MASTFSDIRELGLSGPFNASSLKFKVFVDTDGKYHLTGHRGIEHTNPRTYVKKTAKRTFSQIADCCLKKTTWSDGTTEFRASGVILQRQKLIKSLSESSETSFADSLEVFNAIEDYCSRQLAKSNRARELRSYRYSQYSSQYGQSTVSVWDDEYAESFKQELSRRVELFKSLDPAPLLRSFAKKEFKLDTDWKSLDQGVNQSLLAARKAALEVLVNSKDLYLVALSDSFSLPAWAKAIHLVYGQPNSSFLSVPLAVAERFHQSSSAQAVAKISEAPNKATLEALKVLYKPYAGGPYSNLSTAFKAARVL